MVCDSGLDGSCSSANSPRTELPAFKFSFLATVRRAFTACSTLCWPRSHSCQWICQNSKRSIANSRCTNLQFCAVAQLFTSKNYFYLTRFHMNQRRHIFLHVFYVPFWIQVHGKRVACVRFHVNAQRIGDCFLAERKQLKHIVDEIFEKIHYKTHNCLNDGSAEVRVSCNALYHC